MAKQQQQQTTPTTTNINNIKQQQTITTHLFSKKIFSSKFVEKKVKKSTTHCFFILNRPLQKVKNAIRNCRQSNLVICHSILCLSSSRCQFHKR